MTMRRTLQLVIWRLSVVWIQGTLAALALLAVLLVWPLLGRGLGYVLPQATDFSITSYHVQENGNVVVWGRMKKPWWSFCTFKSNQWYVGRRGLWNRPRGLRFLDEKYKGRTTRPPGASDWGPWLLLLGPDEWTQPQFVDAEHWCDPWGIVRIITPIYDRDGKL
jgi:hypothetical protein